MKNFENVKDILKEVEAAMAKISPNQVHPFSKETFGGVWTDFRYPDDDSNIYTLSVDIDVDCEGLRVINAREQPIPASEEKRVLEFLNLVNDRSATGHFFLGTETKRVLQVGGILVKKKFFHPDELEKLIRVLLGNGELCFKGLREVIQGGSDPLEISQKLFAEVDSHISH